MVRFLVPLTFGAVIGLTLFAGAFTAICWFGSDTFLNDQPLIAAH